MKSLPTVLDSIRQLIEIPSISCTDPGIDLSNRPIIDLLATWYSDLGFDIEIQAVDSSGSKANLIATKGKGSGGLVLSGHTDTVPCDDDLWSHNPFILNEIDNRLYGLGTADMKSFHALVLETLKSFAEFEPAHPIIVLATADEETSMSGARALADAGKPDARYAVIGEPTGLKPVRMHKGILMEAIRLHGSSGHSSDPALGNSALEAMHHVISELMVWREDLQSRYRNKLFKVPVTTLNFGHIHGGDNPNRICGQCELQIDIRPLPGMKLEDLRFEMHNRLATRLEDTGIRMSTIPLFDGIEAMETAADSRIVTAAEKLTGHKAEAVAFGTEAPYFNNMGIETIVLGPGNIAQAHQPDEYLTTSQIPQTVALLKKLVNDFCFHRPS